MTISEVSKKFNLSADTLRYYEGIGLIPSVSRTPGGARDYTPLDCGWIEFMKCMRSAGLPIEVLIEYRNLYKQGDDTVESRKSLLSEQRKLLAAKIEEMQKTLRRLDYKIDCYDQVIRKIEDNLKNSRDLTTDAV